MPCRGWTSAEGRYATVRFPSHEHQLAGPHVETLPCPNEGFVELTTPVSEEDLKKPDDWIRQRLFAASSDEGNAQLKDEKPSSLQVAILAGLLLAPYGQRGAPPERRSAQTTAEAP